MSRQSALRPRFSAGRATGRLEHNPALPRLHCRGDPHHEVYEGWKIFCDRRSRAGSRQGGRHQCAGLSNRRLRFREHMFRRGGNAARRRHWIGVESRGTRISAAEHRRGRRRRRLFRRRQRQRYRQRRRRGLHDPARTNGSRPWRQCGGATGGSSVGDRGCRQPAQSGDVRQHRATARQTPGLKDWSRRTWPG